MEKKRRPRITKPGDGFSLKERPKFYHKNEEQQESSEENFENKTWHQEHKKPSFERKPFSEDQNDPSDKDQEQRSNTNDRNESGGGDFDQRRPYNNDRNEGGGGYGQRRPYDNDRNQGGGGYGERRPYNNDRNQGGGGGFEQRRPYNNDRNQGGGGGYEQRRPYNNDRNQGGGGGYEQRRPYNNDRNQGGGGGYEQRRPYSNDRNQGGGGGGYEQRRPYNNDRNQGGGGGGYEQRRPYNNDRNQGGGGGYGQRRPYNNDRNQGGGYGRKPFGRRDDFAIERKPKPGLPTGEGMPLNKYLAHCGVASRRKAVDYIDQGLVLVNGEVKKEPYYRVQPNDAVICDGKPVQIQERKVYVLLNKPKNVITTTHDEHGRATVLDIVDPHFPERLYPVGRLDRDTTGLLLITNDGELAEKLTHPSHHVQKQYRVGLDRGLSKSDYEKIMAGVELEDGPLQVNWVRYAEDHPGREVVELEIMEGRNRIVRRLFEALGYDVRKLDRFYFAGLTKKELPRGSFRELTQREVIMLKHFTGHPIAQRQQSEFDDENIDIPENFDDDQAH